MSSNPILRWLVLAIAAAIPAAAAGIDFARQIQPILSENCYQCHGPGDSSRKARLRLDTREGALGPGKSGKFAVVPGKPDASELVRRIISTDRDDHMPPADSNKKLSSAQVDLLRRWVAEGGKWGTHWSFVPPELPRIPKAKGLKGANPIDAFIAARLAADGRKLSPAADPSRLIRRVTLDLTGLPPTPEEVAAFEADPSPASYRKAVDRLIDSPRYGERMATDWLDLARFADTHGFQADRYRAVWPWRDWVIGAFNRHLPFDQFVLWQLAGDLLPEATKEQRLATTFNRLHLQNEEGGIVEEEYRVAYNVDRVNTFGTAFLGVTFECSRCHDHKFDPITQREFYQLFAFFQNIDESGQSVYFGDIMPVPTMLLSTDAQDAKLAELKSRITAQEARLKEVAGAARPAFDAWRATNTAPALPAPVASFSFDAMVSNTFPGSAAGQVAKPFDGPVSVEGRSGKALSLSGENGVSMPGVGHFTRADPFSFALWIRPAVHVPRQTVLHHSHAWMDAGSRGYEIVLEDGHVAVGLHHMWPGNSLKVRTVDRAPTNSWTHVAFAYDGSSRAAGLAVYLDGRRAGVEVIRDNLWKDITYGQPDLTIGQRMRDFGFKGGLVDELNVFDRALFPVEVARLAGAQPPSDPESAFNHFLATAHAPYAEAMEELRKLRREQNALVTSIQDIMVMHEMDRPKPAHVLKRGAYDAPADAVSMETPAIMGRLPADAPRNRLGLARWLLDPANPLFARVTVNRVWQQFFGRGIVETSDNFGLQGTPPTHPELLDWLAVTFARGDAKLGIRPWNIQDLQRLVVTSDTYRQTSRASAAEMAADPANRWLARGPARRLTAEMLRDQALFDSGLLVEKVGGPSVKPYQPDGLWEMAMGGARYDTGKGDDLHRRSLYTFWKRTVPPPSMMSLDAADRSYCVVRRQSTSTPLQALALLNDTQVVEAARHLAGRILRDGGATAGQQVRLGFRIVTGRKATDAEAAVLERLLEEQEAGFQKETASAEALLKVGETPVPGEFPAPRLAAMTVLAEALLNHDEAVMRR
jgi:mono/diheme cytochrome c family protein